MIENEVIFRAVNKNIQELMTENDHEDEVLDFYCECSRPDCKQRIKLSCKLYAILHAKEKQFIIKPGHVFTEVEKVISKDEGYQVVEKYFKPPKASEIDFALKAINS